MTRMIVSQAAVKFDKLVNIWMTYTKVKRPQDKYRKIQQGANGHSTVSHNNTSNLTYSLNTAMHKRRSEIENRG